MFLTRLFTQSDRSPEINNVSTDGQFDRTESSAFKAKFDGSNPYSGIGGSYAGWCGSRHDMWDEDVKLLLPMLPWRAFNTDVACLRPDVRICLCSRNCLSTVLTRNNNRCSFLLCSDSNMNMMYRHISSVCPTNTNNGTVPVLKSCQIGMVQKFLQQFLSTCIIPNNECFTTTLLPTITIRGGRGLLQMTIMTLVANPGTFRAATERLCQATCATLENILPNMVRPCPCETASVILTKDLQWVIFVKGRR